MRKTFLVFVFMALAGLALATDYVASPDNSLGQWPLQAAATSGNGNTLDLHLSAHGAQCFISWSAGVNAGAVTLETAPTAGYAGNWSPLAVVAYNTSAAAVPKVDEYTRTQPLRVIRARISTTVTNGTVSVSCGAWK